MGTFGRLKIIVIDRTKMPFLRDAQDLYLNRLSRYTTLKWIEVKPVQYASLSAGEALAREAGLIKKRIAPGDHVIALDKDGRMYSSQGFASHLLQLLQDAKTVVFVVGGALGIGRGILDRANERLSLSTMTLTHEWSRVVLLEQIYRAFTIIRGENYHK